MRGEGYYCVLSADTLTFCFELLSGLFAALTVARMRRWKLHLRYPFLFWYLVFMVPYSIWPAIMDRRSHAYFWLWVVSEPLNWIFEVLVVRELCGLALERFRGLCSLGRWAMYAGIAVSALVSVLSLIPKIPSALSQRSQLLYYWYAGDRGINLSLGVFLLLMALLASRYPVPLRRNIVLNATMFTVLFFGSTLVSVLRSVFDFRVDTVVNIVLTGMSAASLVIWFFYLTPAGEEDQMAFAHFRTADEARILQLLEQINRTVLRLAQS